MTATLLLPERSPTNVQRFVQLDLLVLSVIHRRRVRGLEGSLEFAKSSKELGVIEVARNGREFLFVLLRKGGGRGC